MLAALLLAGCGVRLDTPPPTPAPPSAGEQARQSAAQALQTIANYDGDLESSELSWLIDHAEAQAAALGGVWQDCRQSPACATKAATELPVPTEQMVSSLSTQAESALTSLVAVGDDDASVIAAGILPLLRSELGADNAQGYQRNNWTSDPQLLTDLAWGTWQFQAAAARSGDQRLVALAEELRQSQLRCAKTLSQTELPAFRTLDLDAVELIGELGRQVAGELHRVPAGERAAVIDLLQRLSDELAARGMQLPGSWLDPPDH